MIPQNSIRKLIRFSVRICFKGLSLSLKARIAGCYMSIIPYYGNACVVNGEFNEAEYYYKKSLALDQQRKDTLEQIRIYNNLNYLYLLSGKLDLSVQNAHEGIRLLEIMNQHGTLPKTIVQFGNKSSDLGGSLFSIPISDRSI